MSTHNKSNLNSFFHQWYKRYKLLAVVILLTLCAIVLLGSHKIISKENKKILTKKNIKSALASLEDISPEVGNNRNVTFYPNSSSVHTVTYSIDTPPDENFTVDFKFLLRNWESLQYVAYGWETEEGYLHTKFPHPPQETLLTDTLSNFGYWVRIHNDMDSTINIQNMPNKKFKFFIKGTPMPSGAEITIFDMNIENYTQPYFALGSKFELENFSDWYWENRHRLLTEMDNDYYQKFICYLFKDNPQFFVDNADYFIQTGKIHLENTTPLEWIPGDELPDIEDMTTTHRYLWHALNLPQNLLLAYEHSGDTKYLHAVPQLITNWLEQNIYIKGEDQKYIWYDHGVAERLMVLVHAWYVGLKEGFDVRFMQQLINAIYYHSEILASNWFYAYNQFTIYHNHAIFQDVALLSAANLVPTLPTSHTWKNIAARRLQHQFNCLITGEGALIENSYGYHGALTNICYQVISLLPPVDTNKHPLQTICNNMQTFSENLAYPDGQKPSFGDTHRSDTFNSQSTDSLTFLPKIYFYPESGYFVAKGMAEIPWQLNFIAPSITKTHKHADNLNITFWADGTEWLIDPGYYSHEYDSFIEAYARGPRAHNVPFIPDRHYSLEPGLAKLTSNLLQQQFTVTGETQSLKNSQIKRTISGDINGENISILDEIETSLDSDEIILLPLHLGEQVKVEMVDNGAILTTPNTYSQVHILWDDSLTCQVIHGNDNHADGYGWSFPGFKEKVPTNTILCQVNDTSYRWSINLK